MPLQHKGDISAFTDRLVGVIQLVAEMTAYLDVEGATHLSAELTVELKAEVCSYYLPMAHPDLKAGYLAYPVASSRSQQKLLIQPLVEKLAV